MAVSAEQRFDQFEQQAMEIILGKSKDAFDLSKEDPELVRRYDTGHFNTGLRVARHSRRWASRCCWRDGCAKPVAGSLQFITRAGTCTAEGHNSMCRTAWNALRRPLDQAVSTFLEDVHDRGLSEKILLIITGEFGRTPKVKSDGGRDHWPRLSTLAFAGGGSQNGAGHRSIKRACRRTEVETGHARQPAGDSLAYGIGCADGRVRCQTSRELWRAHWSAPSPSVNCSIERCLRGLRPATARSSHYLPPRELDPRREAEPIHAMNAAAKAPGWLQNAKAGSGRTKRYGGPVSCTMPRPNRRLLKAFITFYCVRSSQ